MQTSLLLASVLAVAAPAALAHAAEPAAQVAAPVEPWWRMLHPVLSADGSSDGLGLRAGLTYRGFEGFVGDDLGSARTRAYGGAKLILLPGEVFTPYAIGRFGVVAEETSFLPAAGLFASVGGGFEGRVSAHAFLFFEMGAVRQLDDAAKGGTSLDVHLGLGARF